jgi:L-histidine N-alpha-methyltransferase
MSVNYKVIDPEDFAESFNAKHAFALDVLVGLCEPRKSLPSKYFYDAPGSELFKKITQLPEYYLTNCEREILESQAGEIAGMVHGAPFNLVELGAGDGQKTKVLLKYLLDAQYEFRYVPIDISESAMEELVESLAEEFPGLEVRGLVSEYHNGLKWLNNRYEEKNFTLLLGSSVGNFAPPEARQFLRNVWSSLDEGDNLLVGFDLKKDIELLLWAYNDREGITREFNLNILRRINRELGGDFNVDNFRHFGTYDVFSGAMESYLVSLEAQSVFIEEIGRSFSFQPWEPIHTEYSYKYLQEDIEDLAAKTGFVVEKQLYDSRHYFCDSIWRVVKPGTKGAAEPWRGQGL